MRASVLGTGRRLPARARVKVSRSDHFRRQPGRQPACMHCMHKNRLNFSDLCVIMHAEFWWIQPARRALLNPDIKSFPTRGRAPSETEIQILLKSSDMHHLKMAAWPCRILHVLWNSD